MQIVYCHTSLNFLPYISWKNRNLAKRSYVFKFQCAAVGFELPIVEHYYFRLQVGLILFNHIGCGGELLATACIILIVTI